MSVCELRSASPPPCCGDGCGGGDAVAPAAMAMIAAASGFCVVEYV